MEWTSIIASLITGILALIGVVLTNNASNNKMQADNAKNQAVTDTKIAELTREVREHNNFAQRIPAIEKDIEHIKDDIEELKRR